MRISPTAVTWVLRAVDLATGQQPSGGSDLFQPVELCLFGRQEGHQDVVGAECGDLLEGDLTGHVDSLDTFEELGLPRYGSGSPAALSQHIGGRLDVHGQQPVGPLHVEHRRVCPLRHRPFVAAMARVTHLPARVITPVCLIVVAILVAGTDQLMSGI